VGLKSGEPSEATRKLVAVARPEATAGSSICAVPLGKPPPHYSSSPSPSSLQHYQLQQEPALGSGYQFWLRPRGCFTPPCTQPMNKFYVIPLFQNYQRSEGGRLLMARNKYLFLDNNSAFGFQAFPDCLALLR